MRGFIFALLLVSASSVAAQTTSGKITGLVLDPAGSAIAGAAVRAVNVETGLDRTVNSNAEGQYLLYPLPAGMYRMTAQMKGFQSERWENIRIDVADTVVRNVTLKVGSLDQTVTVSADAAPLLTQTQSVESTIEREQIEQLPLNSRDFTQLVLLAQGSVETVGSGNRDFGGVSVNGNRSFSNDYMLDGTPNNDLYQGRSAAPISVDLIREFKVTSGVAAAEYGQAGTQVSVVSRSGTNRYHGSLFEYYRGRALQARNPFNTVAPPALPPRPVWRLSRRSAAQEQNLLLLQLRGQPPERERHPRRHRSSRRFLDGRSLFTPGPRHPAPRPAHYRSSRHPE
ncbi:MAG: Plug and carboxypeptidase regulatory-like domain-containing protein [Actinobacteria bacterium]|nr:Plug and carboxypeptidase regulatory-like domain-containing protein [Actinomycetota bacterium]